MDRDAALKEIANEIRVCTACGLHENRKNAVPGAGSRNTQIMLIGEAPGHYENEQGLPFVGASGKFLTHLLLQGGYNREDVFITNVVKCRPPENRDPQQDELQACEKFLLRQIEIINPEIIVTLGRISMGKYFQDVRISQIHGKAALVNGRVVVPMYHPAAALHQPRLRPVVENDFARLPKLIEGAQERRRKKLEEQASFGSDNEHEIDQPKLF